MREWELFIEVEVFDKDGKLKRTTGRIPSKSFTIQYLKHIEACLWSIFGGVSAGITCKDITNTNRTIRKDLFGGMPFMGADAQVNDASYGIVVGTGTGAEGNDNYALDTKIAHGAGAGQLQYHVTDHSRSAVVGINVEYQIRRTFHNASGSTVTVYEVGVYVRTDDGTGSQYYTYCTIRDLNTQAILDDETLSVKYTLVAAF